MKVHAGRSACGGSGRWQSRQAYGGKNLFNGGGSFDKRDKAEVAFAICAFDIDVESAAQKFVPRDVLEFAVRRQHAEVASAVTPWRRNDGGKAGDEGMSSKHNSVGAVRHKARVA